MALSPQIFQRDQGFFAPRIFKGPGIFAPRIYKGSQGFFLPVLVGPHRVYDMMYIGCLEGGTNAPFPTGWTTDSVSTSACHAQPCTVSIRNDTFEPESTPHLHTRRLSLPDQ